MEKNRIATKHEAVKLLGNEIKELRAELAQMTKQWQYEKERREAVELFFETMKGSFEFPAGALQAWGKIKSRESEIYK
jgi:hypothetical protein